MTQPPLPSNPTVPEMRPIGFETLKDVTGYVRTDDGNVLHIRVHINQVVKSKDSTKRIHSGSHAMV